MRHLRRSFWLSDNTLLVLIAITVGLGTATLVLLFRLAIRLVDAFLRTVIGSEGLLGGALAAVGISPGVALLFTLSATGFIVGLIMQYAVGEERYRGVPGIMESVALAGGRLRYRIVPFKALAAALSLGAGASVGAEDPSVQIGASLGSFLSQRLRFSEEHIKLIVAAGAASATAASFNAPIAGVFFAIEIILGEFSTRSIGTIILAAVVSSATTQGITGANPIFGGLDYQLGSPAQLPFYALLGIALAGFSAFALRFFRWQGDRWANINLWTPYKTALTGLVVGGVGLFLPQILGPGEIFMHDVLVGQATVSVWLLLLLGLMKLLLTSLSQGGGFVGGLFAPTLFIGIVLGSAYGIMLNAFIPLNIGNPQAYAIAGMAGLLAGIIRAPITAIMLVFELTDDYRMILPIMLTAVSCSIIMEWAGSPGIYMGALLKHGVHLQRGRDIDIMQGVRVHEAMRTPAPILHQSATLVELRDSFHDQETRSLCVVDTDGNLTGLVTLGDLQRAYETAQQKDQHLQVCDICTPDPLTIAPDESLWRAAREMGARDIGRLPVVDADGRPIGLLRRQDLVKAYNLAISRKFHDQHYAEQIRLNTLTGAYINEFRVRHGCPVAGQQIKDVVWPAEAVIASINRHGKLIIPHGNTVLAPHDKVTVVTDAVAEPVLKHLFGDDAPIIKADVAAKHTE